jgi:hypothetical protein
VIGSHEGQHTSRKAARAGMAAVLALGLLVATSTAVFAAGPVHSQDTLQWPDEVAMNCDGFDVLSTSADLQRNIVTWYDANGDVLQQLRRVHFDFTLTNSETGKAADYVGHFIVSVEAGTLSLIGAQNQVWVDGQPVVREAGRLVFSEDGATFRGLFSDDFEAAVCAALA